jgi:hypothetical protein
MNYYTCCWHSNTEHPCTQRATQFIVFGCLDGHINESVFCYQHSIEWTDNFHAPNGFRCSDKLCKRKLADYDWVSLGRVKHPERLRAHYPDVTIR